MKAGSDARASSIFGIAAGWVDGCPRGTLQPDARGCRPGSMRAPQRPGSVTSRKPQSPRIILQFFRRTSVRSSANSRPTRRLVGAASNDTYSPCRRPASASYSWLCRNKSLLGPGAAQRWGQRRKTGPAACLRGCSPGSASNPMATWPDILVAVSACVKTSRRHGRVPGSSFRGNRCGLDADRPSCRPRVGGYLPSAQ